MSARRATGLLTLGRACGSAARGRVRTMAAETVESVAREMDGVPVRNAGDWERVRGRAASPARARARALPTDAVAWGRPGEVGTDTPRSARAR